MKTRAFRKAISVICVLSMLLSLCVTSLVGTASAAEKEYTLNNNGNVTTDNHEPGSPLPQVTIPNFLGWYDKTLTTKYDVYPDDVTELYAKYGTVTVSGGNDVYAPNGKDIFMEVVSDPDNANNEVFKVPNRAGSFHLAPIGAAGADEGFKPENGKAYVVTFKYKIDNFTPAVQLLLYGSAKAGIGASGNKTAKPLTGIIASGNTDGWETAEINFTYNPSEEYPYLILSVWSQTGTSNVYIDDFKIEPFATQPVVDSFEMDFEDDFKFSNGNDYTYNSGNNFVSRGKIVDIDGNKVFRLMHFQKKKGDLYFVVDDGEKFISLGEGAIYTVSFDYFVEHSETETHVNLYAVNTRDGSATALKTFDNFTYRDDKVEDGWVHATYEFIADDSVTGKNTLGIGLYNATNCPEEYASSVLFDNVVVECHSVSGTDSLIVFDSMGGDECKAMPVPNGTAPTSLPTPTRYGYNFAGWKFDITSGEGDSVVTEARDFTTSTFVGEGVIVYVYATWTLKDGVIELGFRTNVEEYDAEVGTLVAFPGKPVVGMPEDPEFENQKFVGWYLDRNLKNPFDSTKAPEESTILYAKWESDGVVVDYEDYTLTLPGHISTRYKIITEENGNKCLNYNVKYGENKDHTIHTRAMFQDNGEQIRAYEGSSYVVTFKYKVTEFETQGRIRVFLSQRSDTYLRQSQQAGTITYTDNTDGWVEATIEFEATLDAEATSNDNYMSISMNGNANILIDDVVIKCPENEMNVYGSAIRFNVNGGNIESAICGEPGDPIVLPVPVKPGYKFLGWYADNKFNTAFTETTFGEEPILIHAKWQLGKLVEDFEDYPSSTQQLGFAAGYSLYSKDTVGFDSTNIHGGKFSVFRDGNTAGIKNVTLMRDKELALVIGDTYTLTFWVKPTAISGDTGAISLQSMGSYTGITNATPVSVIKNYADLKEGEWQKISFTFTATSEFVAIGTAAGCDMYFDDITITLKGYSGSAASSTTTPPTGDSSVNPMVILAVIILSAGALLVTGKKVFSK